MFNEICINEEMLPQYIHIYIYIYIDRTNQRLDVITKQHAPTKIRLGYYLLTIKITHTGLL